MIGQVSRLSGNPDITLVSRALSELRSGRFVVLWHGSSRALVASAEGLDGGSAAALEGAACGGGRLVLAAARLRRLGHERAGPERTGAGALALPVLDLARIAHLALKVEARLDAPVSPATALDEAALELAKLAYLLPAVIVVPLATEAVVDPLLQSVTTGAITAYRTRQVEALELVARAPVPLEGAVDAEFVVFRGGEGLRDHVAVVVGRPDRSRPVPVRLHSACLTGDLFGSLKCDCGDQLRGTAQGMAREGGGVILYLDQEGRGNGIASKIRAYRLQHEGHDTFEADAWLGYEQDQRRFDFAAAMLRQLGITKVKVLTNNPLKAAALREAGLEVAAEERVMGRLTPQNIRYLTTKRDQAGHRIDLEQPHLLAAAPAMASAQD